MKTHVINFLARNPLVKSLYSCFSTQKMTFRALTLEGSRSRCTRTFSTIWVPINFYFFRRIQQKYNQCNWRHLYALFLTISMLIIFLFSPISANSTSTAKIWPKIIFFAKLIKILSDSKKRDLKVFRNEVWAKSSMYSSFSSQKVNFDFDHSPWKWTQQ